MALHEMEEITENACVCSSWNLPNQLRCEAALIKNEKCSCMHGLETTRWVALTLSDARTEGDIILWIPVAQSQDEVTRIHLFC